LVGKSSQQESIGAGESQGIQALDQSISVVIELLEVPVDILGVESDGVPVLVGEVLGVEGGEVVGNCLDEFHCFRGFDLISQIYNFY
jgi:hypothetical protein